MNILLINHYAGTPALGMEYRPYYLAREWVSAGHRVQIVAAAYSHVRTHQPAVMMVTHDVDEAMALADRVLVLDAGRIIAEEVITAPRGARTAAVRPLRTRLLGHLGVEAPEGSYADAVAYSGDDA